MTKRNQPTETPTTPEPVPEPAPKPRKKPQRSPELVAAAGAADLRKIAERRAAAKVRYEKTIAECDAAEKTKRASFDKHVAALVERLMGTEPS